MKDVTETFLRKLLDTRNERWENLLQQRVQLVLKRKIDLTITIHSVWCEFVRFENDFRVVHGMGKGEDSSFLEKQCFSSPNPPWFLKIEIFSLQRSLRTSSTIFCSLNSGR